MTERQIELFLEQAFFISAQTREIVRGTGGALDQALTRIERITAQLPPVGDPARLKAWRAMVPEVASQFQGVQSQLLNEMAAALAAERIPDRVASIVSREMEALGIAQPAALAPRADLRGVISLDEATRTNVSGLVPAATTRVDRLVVQGILDGNTTAEIAGSLSTIVKGTQANIRTQARTFAAQTAENVRRRTYEANAEALADLEWEWVAVLDAETCPICAPLDGEVRDELDDWSPFPPVHWNCRCQIHPYDEDEERTEATAQELRDRPPTHGGKTWKEMTQAEKMEASQAGVYATKRKSKGGEKFYRRAVKVQGTGGKRPTVADFIQQSNDRTKIQFFGGGKVGKARMELFDKHIKSGASPKAALNRLVDNDRFVKL